jgi:hypothetical protein
MSTVNDWANQQRGDDELGDRRRTQRAVRLGAQIATHQAAGLPGQTRSWERQCHLHLRENYDREAPQLVRQIGRYAHARQYRRMRAISYMLRSHAVSSPVR